MKTLTELLKEEAAQRERADQYEKSLGRLNNARKEVASLTPRLAHYQQQITLLEAVAAQARSIDPEIIARESYAARDIITAHCGAAKGFAAAKLAKIEKQLATLQQDIPRLEAVVGEIEAA